MDNQDLPKSMVPFFFARLSKCATHANRHEGEKALRNNLEIKCIRGLTTNRPHRVSVLNWD